MLGGQVRVAHPHRLAHPILVPGP
ncbi:MAG: hypothetical protein QOJ44_2235, partial [Acidimicrobiaceae bacterium]|nr:hypothetical protein [Acidimicrobiaceae bacterium]